MRPTLLALTALSPIALACALPALAQDTPPPSPLSPGEIVAAAPADEWVPIAAEDLLVMTLAPDAKGRERKVVIQLIPRPFSQGWVENIRTLARAQWFDGVSVVRVQDNYVTQWGDPADPDKGETPKPLPEGLKVMQDKDYVARTRLGAPAGSLPPPPPTVSEDPYAEEASFASGFPVAKEGNARWPVHCYSMVGVGRGLSPDTGDGSALYTVIGHAPRHLDRNIALVGRVIEGMEHLSSLPRGTGTLGFYETAEERTTILSIRVASELSAGEQPKFEYLNTSGESFDRYAEARANRLDAFFNVPAGGADICNIPVPVRRATN